MADEVLGVEWHGGAWDDAIADRDDIVTGGGAGEGVLYRPDELVVTTEALGRPAVAAALGRPIGSLGPTRRRCLERLRQAVEPAGISAAITDS